MFHLPSSLPFSVLLFNSLPVLFKSINFSFFLSARADKISCFSNFGNKSKSTINLGRNAKRKSAIHEALEYSSGTGSPPTESSTGGESKRDSGKYGTVGRSMFGGVGKQWGSIFIGGAGAGTKNQSARIPVPTVNIEDYPR